MIAKSSLMLIVGLLIPLTLIAGIPLAGAEATESPDSPSEMSADAKLATLPEQADDVVVDIKDLSDGDRAQAAANAFDAYRDRNPVSNYSSYALTGDGLIYYVAGSLDAADSDVLENLSREYGVNVDVRPTPFERKALITGITEMLPKLATIPEYAQIGPTKDRQAILIGVDGEVTPSLRARFESLTNEAFPGVPVVYEYAKKASGGENLVGRQSDTSPFFGGGAIINGAGAICSLGFRAYRPSTSSYIELTANHCRDSFATSWSTFAGSSVGNNSAGSSVTDSMIVTPASGKAFSNGMWYGSYYVTTSRPIPTGYNPGDGTTVYANGALRGQSTQAVADIDRFVGTQGPLFLIQSTNGGRNIGGGDSGGPVYNLINGSGVGRGLINEALASSFKGSCTQGDPDFDYTGCYASVWASQIDEIEDVLNVSVG